MASPAHYRQMKARQPLSVQTKQVIMNVYCKLREKRPKQSITSIVEETVELTGVSSSTVYTIKKDVKSSSKPTPPRRTFFRKTDSGKAHCAKKFDTFTLTAIRRIVHNFFFANIVIDNASYHSVKVEKIPQKSTRKAEIQAWLTDKDIPWTPDMIIAELIPLVNSVRHIYDAYRIDSIGTDAGHTILRLPSYHCELNPIELVWGHVKNRIASQNRNFTLSQVKVLAENALSQETEAMWRNSVKHVIGVERKFWDIDNLTDDYISSFIITANTGDSDSSEDSEDDSDFVEEHRW